jgi:flagellar motility protein MotE (MotC chaperone)
VTLAQSWRNAFATERPRGRGALAALLLALAALVALRLGLAAGGLLQPSELPAPAPALAQVTELAPATLPEPAAGPEEAAGEPLDEPADEPPLEVAAGEPPSAAPVPLLDPARLTASEIAVLHQLAARREVLDRRARELDERGLLVETAAAGLERQIARLGELRDQIAAMVEAHDAAEDAKLASLVKIYETMKPKAAAEIFDRLEMAVLIRVVERMRETKSADVLARMDPIKARQVTSELARRTELLEAARESAAVAEQHASGT